MLPLIMGFRFPKIFLLAICLVAGLTSCYSRKEARRIVPVKESGTKHQGSGMASPPLHIDADDMIRFAKRYIGVPYRYASIDPERGFDCSGFVYHVLTHFGAIPPRASYQYTNWGKDVKLRDAQRGDLILFTGPSGGSKVGHMGIITDNGKNGPEFIHASTSRGVILSSFGGYYRDHFVKVIRILK